MFSGFSDKLNSAAGGGKESEKNEDMLDKGTTLSESYLHSHIFFALLKSRMLVDFEYPRHRLRPREIHGSRTAR